jgi:mannose-6-phosphate isomerase-like protein (cupin superfamily)
VSSSQTTGYSIKAIDEMASTFHGAVKLAGAELGIRAFGMQVLDLPAGFSDYPEHDHAEDGQEEVYVVLAGDARFVINGEDVPAVAGEALRVDPATRRTMRPGPHGVRVLALGCAPGEPYERADDFKLAVST